MGVNGQALQLHAVYKKPCFFTTSHARDKIIITIEKNITFFFSLELFTRNNTDGNKLMIHSSIVLYYGDNYIYIKYPLLKDGCSQ